MIPNSNGIDFDFISKLERSITMTNKEMLQDFFETHAFQDYPQLVQALATFEVAEAIRDLKYASEDIDFTDYRIYNLENETAERDVGELIKK